MRVAVFLFVVLVFIVFGLLFAPKGDSPDGGGKNANQTQSDGKTGGDGADGKGRVGSLDRPFTFINNSKHHTLDPQNLSYMIDLRVCDAMYEGLYAIGVPSFKVEPGVAEKHDLSEDGLTYTFHLRKNAKWSNGDPVTAEDFVFAWRRALMPDTGAEYATLFFHIKGGRAFYDWRQKQTAGYAKRPDSEKSTAAASKLWTDALNHFDEAVGLKAIDEHTLAVTLETPAAYFPEVVAFGVFAPVHRPTVTAAMSEPDASTGMVSTDAGWTKPGTVVSNGPYTLAKRDPGVMLRLEANPHYWDAASVKEPVIIERIIEDAVTQMVAYDKGEADWLPGVPTNSRRAADLLATARAGKRDDVFHGVAAGTYFYKFNCAPKLLNGLPNPLADARVRRALSMAIDRKTLVEKATGVFQPVAKTFVPPGSIDGYEPPADAGVSFDPAKAKALLKEAGYEGGKGIENLDIVYGTSGAHAVVAQAIAGDWKRHLGIIVRLRGMEDTLYQAELNKGSFTIARAGWFGDYRYPNTFLQYFATGDGHNDGKYSNPEYDALLEASANETDPVKALEHLRQAETILLRDQPLAPIFHYINMELWRPAEVRGLKVNAWNNWRLDQIERIRP